MYRITMINEIVTVMKNNEILAHFYGENAERNANEFISNLECKGE